MENPSIQRLCNFFLRCDPESNGLLERVIKNIKIALTAKLDRNHWFFYFGASILSLDTMHPAEFMCFQVFDYRTFLQHRQTTDTRYYISNESVRCITQANPNQGCTKQAYTHTPKLETCSHVLIIVDPFKPNLTPTYAGPYSVMSRREKMIKILHNDKLQQVAINNVKPSFPLQSPEHIAA